MDGLVLIASASNGIWWKPKEKIVKKAYISYSFSCLKLPC